MFSLLGDQELTHYGIHILWLVSRKEKGISKLSVLWQTVFFRIIGGFWCSFLGQVDLLGVAFESPTIATGYGAYIAQVCMFCVCPILNYLIVIIIILIIEYN